MEFYAEKAGHRRSRSSTALPVVADCMQPKTWRALAVARDGFASHARGGPHRLREVVLFVFFGNRGGQLVQGFEIGL